MSPSSSSPSRRPPDRALKRVGPTPLALLFFSTFWFRHARFFLSVRWWCSLGFVSLSGAARDFLGDMESRGTKFALITSIRSELLLVLLQNLLHVHPTAEKKERQLNHLTAPFIANEGSIVKVIALKIHLNSAMSARTHTRTCEHRHTHAHTRYPAVSSRREINFRTYTSD